MTTKNPQRRTPFTRHYLILGLIGLALGMYLGFAPEYTPPQPPVLKQATLLTPPKLVESPDLVDHDGKPFTGKSMQGQWSFFFFGYTNCPDVCPATMFVFKNIAKKLESMPKLKKQTRFVLASIDPQRDTVAHLKQYVQYYHPGFLGLTGTSDNLHKFSRQMGVIYGRSGSENPNDKDNYLIDHSSAILLVNPQGHLQAVFSAPHDPDTMLEDYQAIHSYLTGS